MFTQILLIAALLFAAGIAKAVMDTLQFHYVISIFYSDRYNQNFWDPDESWRNKYKDLDPNKGARFPGSTTWLVWTTDAWHLFQMVFLTCLQLAIVLPLTWLLALPAWAAIAGVAIAKAVQGASFQAFYKYFLIKDQS
jgi:hypothetical protein